MLHPKEFHLDPMPLGSQAFFWHFEKTQGGSGKNQANFSENSSIFVTKLKNLPIFLSNCIVLIKMSAKIVPKLKFFTKLNPIVKNSRNFHGFANLS